ncbi:MAG: hypothetical protein IJO97_00700 [Lachnospiraceae bacterium]|nr:hypothetical protein [Lachnospiraceae bacterium]
MSYWHRNWQKIILVLFPCAAYNLYFLFLLPQVNKQYLFYLDFLMAICIAIYIGYDWKRDKHRQDMLALYEQDKRALEEELQKEYEENCELQDYIARWCHEVKIPLSASLLMTEKMEDAFLRSNLQEQLERIRLQLNGALLGCKVQSKLFDLQIHPTNLLECVKTSIHNNQFFLIRNNFIIEMKSESMKNIQVYSDKAWLVYILDQMIQNAVKYQKNKEAPVLKIGADTVDKKVCLWIEDNGEGIKESDIRRIFDKGFTGSNYHNGKYKSTGMGLYMVSLIGNRLGHAIEVESEYGSYTRFTILFSDKNVR